MHLKAPRQQGEAPAASVSELPAFLRAAPDPARTLDDAAIHARLLHDPAGFLVFARRYLGAVAAGQAQLVQPPKMLFPARGGSDFRVMPCVVDGPGGYVATVKLVGTNRAQKRLPGQVTVGQVCVVDPDEGCISHRFDACALSSARTGLCAALVVEQLAADREAVALVGGGRVGYYAARYLAALGGVYHLSCYDADPARARACIRALAPDLPGIRLEVATAADQASAVAILATTSRAPFWSLPGAALPALVVSLGADTLDQRELQPAWAGAELYTDAGDSVECGDLAAWRRAGLLRAPPVELLTLLRTGAAPLAGPRAFISTGSALLDNVACAYLLAQLA